MNIGVIGAGFSGISAAAVMASQGHDVHVYEKHEIAGGRARQFARDGFKFDMGPSWYWMPDVFERFFARFGYEPSDFYQLEKLNPAFKVFLADGSSFDVPGSYDGLRELFEHREKGAAAKLDKFMDEAEFKYKLGMDELVYKQSASWMEYLTLPVIRGAARLDVFTSLRKHVRKFFKDPALVTLMEFPVLFLGAMPDSTPALYSLMNYAGFKVGTYYPQGGFAQVVAGMKAVAQEQGVNFHFEESVDAIKCSSNRVTGLEVNGGFTEHDGIVASADYHHVDQHLLPTKHKSYSPKYWKNRVLAPSCLIFYVGLDTKVEGLEHHNLFFDAPLDEHAEEIYNAPKWPTDPLFYVSCPSKTDSTVAPEGCENMFFLMPIAPDLEDTEEHREQYFDIMMNRLEKRVGHPLRQSIITKRSYCVKDFVQDYNALRGNAYGLANTLTQTAVLKPSIKHKNLRNLVFAGHLTVPGPGVPPAIISGQVAADALLKNHKPK